MQEGGMGLLKAGANYVKKTYKGMKRKAEEVKKDKDGKPLVNGKTDEPTLGGMGVSLKLQGIQLIDRFSARRAQ